MTSGYFQGHDFYADGDTREEAENQRRLVAERIQDFLSGLGGEQPPIVDVTRLVRSYTVAFTLHDGGNGMVLIWSERDLAVTFQPGGSALITRTLVFHSLDELLKNLRTLCAEPAPDRTGARPPLPG
jgi:hypothetical protein